MFKKYCIDFVSSFPNCGYIFCSLETSSASRLSSCNQRNWIPTGLKLVCTDDGEVTAENVDEEV